MSEMEAHTTTSGGHGSKYSFGEHFIALLSSFTIGFFAYGGLWFLIVLYRWIPTLLTEMAELKSAMDSLGLTPYKPVSEFSVNLFNYSLDLFFYVPLLFGVISAFINYGKVLDLEDN